MIRRFFASGIIVGSLLLACAQQTAQTHTETTTPDTTTDAPKKHWVRTSANPDQMATVTGQAIGQIAVAAARGCSLLR